MTGDIKSMKNYIKSTCTQFKKTCPKVETNL